MGRQDKTRQDDDDDDDVGDARDPTSRPLLATPVRFCKEITGCLYNQMLLFPRQIK